ncbi:MAG: hypothetical protein WC506_01735 [Candidatus Micrarchaeia archaeon]
MAKQEIKFVMKGQEGGEKSQEDDYVEDKKNQSQKEKQAGAKKPEVEATMAAAAYAVSIILPAIGPAAVYFMAQPEDKYTRHHAAVAASLSLVSFIALAALAISIVGLCLALPGALAYIGGMIYLAMRAKNLEPVEVPIFKDFGARFE